MQYKINFNPIALSESLGLIFSGIIFQQIFHLPWLFVVGFYLTGCTVKPR